MRTSDMTTKVPLELFCLELLQERDMYGYEMTQEIRKRSGGFLNISVANLYLALKRLCAKGYVSVRYTENGTSRERSRIYYRLEASAEEYCNQMRNDYMKTAKGIRAVLNSFKQKK